MTDARLAQSVEHETLNLRVVGSSPTLGAQLLPHSMGETDKRDGGDERQRRLDGASRFEGKTFHALKLTSSGKPFDSVRLENWNDTEKIGRGPSFDLVRLENWNDTEKIGRGPSFDLVRLENWNDTEKIGKLERYREDPTGPLRQPPARS